MTFFIDEANHIYIAMPVYNLIEYIDKYQVHLPDVHLWLMA